MNLSKQSSNMSKFTYKALCIFIVFSFGELVFSQDVSPSVVQTKNGPLQGILKQSRAGTNYVAFLGLRYANPPKRFEPPEALEDTWKEPRIVDNPGPQCTQLVFGPPDENENANQSEDCLYLHVYVPQRVLEGSTSKHLPVMFWVHGGGFITGDGFNYSPEYLMDYGDVIVVTVNYRLGVFGFLGTGDNTVTANNGLRDVVQALKWVRENIAAFKGDHNKVTLFENSAGSASVHFLLMTPLAEGLFHRAILQSGSFSFWSYDFDPRETALKLAKYMECPLTSDGGELSAEIRKCLEGKTATELNTAQIMFWPRWPEGNIITRFVPTAEEGRGNPFFAGRPGAMYGKGRKLTYRSKVPTIVGVMKDEGSLLFATMVLSDEKALNALRERWNELIPTALCIDTFISTKHLSKASEKIREFYFGSRNVSLDTSQNFSDMYSDALFLIPVLLAGQEMAKDGLAVYPYIFSYDGVWSASQIFGVMDLPGMIGHGDELQYLFQHPYLGPSLKPHSEDEIFSRKLVALWKSFAKHAGSSFEWDEDKKLTWTPIKSEDMTADKLLNFELLNIDQDPTMIKNDFNERARFWIQLLQKYGRRRPESESGHKTEL